MFNFLKFKIFHKPLTLHKAHDFCASKKPKMTVVFVHGIAADATSFSKALKYLEGTNSMKDVRFVAFDLLGSGKSYHSDDLNYDFNDQIKALENSIKKLKAKTPLVMVGHSMGTLIATRYAAAHKKAIKRLILVSPPVYREEDVKNPMFKTALDTFRKIVAKKSKKILTQKAFVNEMELIVSNPKNYKFLATITTPTVLIYGDMDQIIASFNIPGIVKKNPKYISTIKTIGGHSVSRDKYVKILDELEEVLHEII